MDNQLLILTVGLPRSGKTTWCQETCKKLIEDKGLCCCIINPDTIRYELHGQRFVPSAEPLVWYFCNLMVRTLFHSGVDVILLDATNITVARRREWLSKSWMCKYKVFNTSKNECISRAKAIGDDYIIPIIERMSNKFELLTETERSFLYE